MLKNVDSKGRWRKVNVGFRMSKEESDLLNIKVKLSGFSKQDYLIRRSLEKEIIVVGNPRVYKALKNQMEEIYEELKRIESCSELSDEYLETLQLISNTLYGIKKEKVLIQTNKNFK